MKTTTTPGLRIVPAFLILMGLAGPAAAQSAADTCDRYPSLGITGIDCRNCTISRSGPDRWAAFSTEPRILSVAADGPAAGILRVDDVLVAVDGHLVTTREGGRAFTAFEVGDEVHLRVRRDGRERDVVVVAEALCAPPPAPAPAATPAPGAAPVPEAAAAPPAPAPSAIPAPQAAAPPPAPEPPVEVAGRMWRYSRGLPRLGMSLSCDGCTLRVDDEEGSVWSFDQYPEVLSVEDGSAAAEAGFRGGDVLLRIDGIDLRTPEGGRRMARVRPGERVEWQIARDGVVATLRQTLPAAPSPPAPAGSTAALAPAPPGPVRAVTRLGDVFVEVRGDPVVVLEDDDVVVIRAEGVEVRLVRRPPPPAPPGGGR